MADEKYDVLGPLLEAIGQEAKEILGGNKIGFFLYVEAGPGWNSASLYHDEGNRIVFVDHNNRLDDMLFEAWEMEDIEKRWSVMEYFVNDDEFVARFSFPDEVDVSDMDFERREAALKARYGDKPVFYPPFKGTWELAPEPGTGQP